MTLQRTDYRPVPHVETRHIRPAPSATQEASEPPRGHPGLWAGLPAGPANVIMQLARPTVGYGVTDGRAVSGRGAAPADIENDYHIQ
ncbi:hypothetical protein BST27_10195 [Mycobacterium intermedium]|uniref:Uncharacterized protein n=1 Tax=Mycobacterium intermedium TaxID=28445 RepID=A0A1T3W1T5_MYCIE|nr:hypothetical protein BV508_18940 [Mycobacterium intermedium]ORB06906.1 hypothetical protein BST27_10195 [Mycobacterium intermedium]